MSVPRCVGGAPFLQGQGERGGERRGGNGRGEEGRGGEGRGGEEGRIEGGDRLRDDLHPAARRIIRGSRAAGPSARQGRYHFRSRALALITWRVCEAGRWAGQAFVDGLDW